MSHWKDCAVSGFLGIQFVDQFKMATNYYLLMKFVFTAYSASLPVSVIEEERAGHIAQCRALT